jgi:predicted nucleic acid-binding protein
MRPRVLCDTNLLVSSFITGGPPSRVIEAAIKGRIELVLAEPVLDELARVLLLELQFEPERIKGIQVLLLEVAGDRVPLPSGVARAVTGDRKHLLPVVEYEGVRIVTPQALLAEIANA